MQSWHLLGVRKCEDRGQNLKKTQTLSSRKFTANENKCHTLLKDNMRTEIPELIQEGYE